MEKKIKNRRKKERNEIKTRIEKFKLGIPVKTWNVRKSVKKIQAKNSQNNNKRNEINVMKRKRKKKKVELKKICVKHEGI